MDKHLSIAVTETKQALVNVLNESCLPGCIMQMILKDIVEAVDALAQREYQMDLEAEKAEKEGKGNDDSNNPE